MKRPLIAVSICLALTSLAPAAQAGCGKGALVGGVAGHVAGKHGLLGAAAGCAIGSHMSKKKAATAARTAPAGSPVAPASK